MPGAQTRLDQAAKPANSLRTTVRQVFDCLRAVEVIRVPLEIRSHALDQGREGICAPAGIPRARPGQRLTTGQQRIAKQPVAVIYMRAILRFGVQFGAKGETDDHFLVVEPLGREIGID